MARRMLGGIPEDIRSDSGSLLVCSVPLDSTEVPTFAHCIPCKKRPLSTGQAGPKETERFSQVLRHTYSDNIYLSFVDVRRLGGLFVVQKPPSAYHHFSSPIIRFICGQEV